MPKDLESGQIDPNQRHICQCCFYPMAFEDGWICKNPRCKDKSGLRYDWSVPESAKVRHISFRKDEEK